MKAKRTSKLKRGANERAFARSQQRVVGRMNRLSIRFNGDEIIGATVTCEHPKNSDEMAALLRELLAMHEAPDVADPEVLGRYSPNAGTQRGRDAEATNATETRTRPSLE